MEIIDEFREVASALDPVLESFYNKGYDVMSLYLATTSWSKGLREYMRSEHTNKEDFDRIMDDVDRIRATDAAKTLRPTMEKHAPKMDKIHESRDHKVIFDRHVTHEELQEILKSGKASVEIVQKYNGKHFPAGQYEGTNDPIVCINWGLNMLKKDKVIDPNMKLSAQAYDILALRLNNEVLGTKKEYESRDPMKVLSSFLIGYASGHDKLLKNVGDAY